MSASASTRVLLVDDEEPARELLRTLLCRVASVEIVGEAASGEEALRLVRERQPQVVFLDVQMPGVSGMEVAAAIAAYPDAPLVVFVTAYDTYAIKAFEVSACDYLMKPFDAIRLSATMTRVAGRLASRASSAPQPAIPVRHSAASQRLLALRSGDRHVLVHPRDIEWVNVEGKETHVHVLTSDTPITVLEPLATLIERLDPAGFLRVHRSVVVNRLHVRELQAWFKGDYVIVLRRGAKVISGKTYRENVRELLR